MPNRARKLVGPGRGVEVDASGRLNLFLEPELMARVQRVAYAITAAQGGEPSSIPNTARIAMRIGLQVLEDRLNISESGADPRTSDAGSDPHSRGGRSR